MPEPTPEPRLKIERVQELENKVAALEKFCKDLIASLEYAEKHQNLLLLPEGTYFGKRIE